jgi:purine-binding chemotaxis protein CheW
VVDLSAKFGNAETELTRTTCIVVVETRLNEELLTIGVVSSAVSEVVDIADAAIEPAPSFGTGVSVDFLTGMGKLDGRLVLILDIDRVLSPVEIQQTIEAVDDLAAVAV